MLNFLFQKSIHKKAADLSLCLFFLLAFFSCEEFVSIPPPGAELVQEKVFEDDATALAAMSSVYAKLSDGSFADGNFYSVTYLQGLYSDELIFSTASPTSSEDFVEFYLSSVSPLNGSVSRIWGDCYRIIYECNRILEGLQESEAINAAFKSQLSGEALFIRAFCHFYLVNLFGDIPLIKTTDYRFNTNVPREPTADVYEAIISDLLEAKNLLQDSYPSAERVRVNYGAATALLARLYLYTSKFADAEGQATEVINKTSQYKLAADLNTVFLKNSEEAIWQLLPKGGVQKFTFEGALFIPTGSSISRALSNDLYDAFETGDFRRTYWVGTLSATGNTWHYAFKYKQKAVNADGTEYSMVMRLAEQYLIRAEARAHLGKLVGTNSAFSDINIVRARAGLGVITAVTLEDLLVEIDHERRVEFFTEWGHRFFDLKRWEKLDEVLGPIKPDWKSTAALLPLPHTELLTNQSLAPQNPGY